MMNPDFDPGGQWCDGLLAGMAILLVTTLLVLLAAQFGINPLERLLG